MNNKYRILIIASAVCCVILIAAAASADVNSGTLLYGEAVEGSNTIHFQSESGSSLSAIIDTGSSSVSTVSDSEPDPEFVPEYTVNINTASAYELAALLPGIGEKKAEAIVEYRNVTGGFSSVDELIEVDSIGKSLLERIRPYCVVSDNEPD